MRQLRLSTNRIVSNLDGRFNRGCSSCDGQSVLLVSDTEAALVDIGTGVVVDIPLACPSTIETFAFLIDGSAWFGHESGMIAKV